MSEERRSPAAAATPSSVSPAGRSAFERVCAGDFPGARVVARALAPRELASAASAWIALEWGDADRAARALPGDEAVASEDVRVVRWIVGLETGRPTLLEPEAVRSALAALTRTADGSPLATGAALRALARGDASAARDVASSGEDHPQRVLLRAALAEHDSDFAAAFALYLDAADRGEAQGFARVAGRALLGAARVAKGSGDPSAILARAHAHVGRSGSPIEQLELRRAYRTHGRRAIDRLAPSQVSAALDQLFDARRRIDDAVAEVEEGPEAPSTDALRFARVRAAAEAISESERALTISLDRLLAERARAGELAAALGRIARANDRAALLDAALASSQSLFAADHVGIAVFRHGRLEPARAVGPRRDDDWLAHCGASSAASRAGREGSELRGPRVAVALPGQGAPLGWLYADRVDRHGRFTAGEAVDITVFAEFVAIALQRIDALERVSTAAERTAATVAALRDGVIAVDDRQRVTVLNPAARRMLSAPPEIDVGSPLDALPHMAAFAERLRAGDLPENETLRAQQHDLVVSTRPVPLGAVLTLVDLGRVRALAGQASAARFTFGDLIGEAPAFRRAVQIARTAASVDTTLLIIGESGTGKEMFAQAIHNAGARASEPFVGINCAALPRELIEAELFGYESGAFTGARASGSPGKLDLAGAGTLLLDEIGEMPLDLQAKLLRVLQERRYVPVGGVRERTLCARVIATTNRDLQLEVQGGTFRLDLYHRLRVLYIPLPPLRERPGDVPLLVARTLQETARRYGKRVREASPSVIELFERARWPGNVRELVNVVEAEVALAPDEAIALTRVPPTLNAAPGETTTSESAVTDSGDGRPAVRPLEQVERDAIVGAVASYAGNIAGAARALGISKVTLYAKLRQYGLEPNEMRGPESRRSYPPPPPRESGTSPATIPPPRKPREPK